MKSWLENPSLYPILIASRNEMGLLEEKVVKAPEEIPNGAFSVLCNRYEGRLLDGKH